MNILKFSIDAAPNSTTSMVPRGERDRSLDPDQQTFTAFADSFFAVPSEIVGTVGGGEEPAHVREIRQALAGRGVDTRRPSHR